MQDKETTEKIFNRPFVELHSSPTEFEQGMSSPFWQDMRRALEAWLSDVRDALEDPDNLLLDKTLHRLGGNAEAIRRVLVLPEETLRNIKDNLKEM